MSATLPALTLTGIWAIRHLSAPGVRRWRPGTGERMRAGPLAVRVLGTGDPVVVLLHGLAASGEYFGATFDELGRNGTLVVPDLLGFGASMRPPGGDPAEYGTAAHVAALDAMLASLGLGDRPLVIAGHSMGAVLGVRWAARLPMTRAVVAFAAPLYLDPRQARAQLCGLGMMAALVTGDGPVPAVLCEWMCRYRRFASWVTAALHPELPVPIARAVVRHTWASYRGSLTDVILADGWRGALDRLARAGVPLLLAEGGTDSVPVPGHAAALAAASTSVTATTQTSGGHDLPLTHPRWCLAQLRRALTDVSLPE